jgi:uncharacterized protein YjbI with pentapeptide repeats
VPLDGSRSGTACKAAGCAGSAVGGAGACWEHLTDDALNAALDGIGAGERLLGGGARLSAKRLEAVLAAAPRDGAGRPMLNAADLSDCIFAAGASFAGAHFTGPLTFDGARFEGDASFAEAFFDGAAWFEGTVFAGDAWFTDVRLGEGAWFLGTRFADVSFAGSRFDADASFHQAAFAGHAPFDNAEFGGDLTFSGVSVDGDAAFAGTAFAGATAFAGTRVRGAADFVGCRFATSRQLGPLLVEHRLHLDGSSWAQRCRIEASTTRVSARGACFDGGVHLAVRGADVVLDEADLAAPSTVSHAPPFTDLAQPGDVVLERVPQVLSLQRADVAGLTLREIDLSLCRFDGAHQLDQLRMVAVRTASTPRSWWRANRSVVAEEQHWRARHARTQRSRAAWQRAAGAGEGGLPPPLPATEVASIYRELRRGREAIGDESGAGDFYYGEMEMRRAATEHRRAQQEWARAAAGEHVLLTLYWFASGYGLRAWRALTNLTVLLLVAGATVDAWGLRPEGQTGGWSQRAKSLLICAQAATAILDSPDPRLTQFGQWVQVGLRLAGPVLLGLAVLAVRGRARR